MQVRHHHNITTKVAALCVCCRLPKNATPAATVKLSDSLAGRLAERPRLTAIDEDSASPTSRDSLLSDTCEGEH